MTHYGHFGVVFLLLLLLLLLLLGVAVWAYARGHVPPDPVGNKQRRLSVIDLQKFCKQSVPEFRPLGGGRPDAAVVACTAVWMEEEEETKADVYLPPDVLDTALAMLCSPLTVTHAGDLRGRETHFKHSPAATVRLLTCDEDAVNARKQITAHMEGGLLVTVVLGQSVTELPDNFLHHCTALECADFGWTSLRRIGRRFLCECAGLTAVTLPQCLTEVGDAFLLGCTRLQQLEMQHTALHTVSIGSCVPNPAGSRKPLPKSARIF